MPQLLHPLQETSLSCRIPYPQGTPDQVIFGYKAKQTRIGKIDRIVGSHPVIVLAEGIFSHRTAFHIECVSLHTGLLMLMTHNGIAEKHSIPGINFYRNLLAGYDKRMCFLRDTAVERNNRNPAFQLLGNQIELVMAEAADITPSDV